MLLHTTMPSISPAPGSAEFISQKEHWEDNIQPQSYAGLAICGVAATVFLIIRLLSQRRYNKGFFVDDWLIIAAWVRCSVPSSDGVG